jgi:hypothetical protein
VKNCSELSVSNLESPVLAIVGVQHLLGRCQGVEQCQARVARTSDRLGVEVPVLAGLLRLESAGDSKCGAIRGQRAVAARASACR